MDFGIQNTSTTNLGDLNNEANLEASVAPQTASLDQQPVTPAASQYSVAPTSNTIEEVNINANKATLAVGSQIMTNQLVTEVNTDTNVKEANIALTNETELKVKIEKLQAYLRNISSIVSNEPRIGTADIVQFTFTENGLKVTASDGNSHIVQKDPTIRYQNEINFGMNRMELQELVMKLDGEQYAIFNLVRTEDNSNIIVTTSDGGEFKFEEKVDVDGSAVNLPIPEELNTTPTTFIEKYTEFKNNIKACAIYAKTNPVGHPKYGVRGSQGRLFAIGQANMIACKLPEEIKDYDFYIRADIAENLAGIEFGTHVEVGLCKNPIDNPSISKCIVIKGTNCAVMTSCYVDEYTGRLPVAMLDQVTNAQLVNKAIVNASSMYRAIDIVHIFNPNSADADKVRLQFANEKIKVTSFQNRGKAEVLLEQGTLNLPEQMFDCKLAGVVFQNAGNKNVIIGTDGATPTLTMIYDDVVASIAIMEG